MDTALGVGLGLGGAIITGLLGFRLLQEYAGLFSYPGLSRADVTGIMQKLDKQYIILSRVQGRGLTGSTFYRGIYIGHGGAGYPLYYRYEYWPSGKATFDLYPLFWEQWTTVKNVLPIEEVHMI